MFSVQQRVSITIPWWHLYCMSIKFSHQFIDLNQLNWMWSHLCTDLWLLKCLTCVFFPSWQTKCEREYVKFEFHWSIPATHLRWESKQMSYWINESELSHSLDGNQSNAFIIDEKSLVDIFANQNLEQTTLRKTRLKQKEEEWTNSHCWMHSETTFNMHQTMWSVFVLGSFNIVLSICDFWISATRHSISTEFVCCFFVFLPKR